MDLGLSGRVAVITGASRGIGLATARLLAAEGATLVLCARDASRLKEAAAGLERSGAAVVPVPGDVLDPELPGRLTQAAGGDGRVDVLVNNAGGDSGYLGFEKLADADWEATYRLNVVAPVRLIRSVLPGMRRRRWGASSTSRPTPPGCQNRSACPTPRRPW